MISMHDQEERLTALEEREAEWTKEEQIARMRAISEAKKNPWVYIPEAQEILDKSGITLQRWRSRGYGPAWHKNGSRVVYRRADLEAWMMGGDSGDGSSVTRAPTNPSPAPEAQKKAAPETATFSMTDGRRAVRGDV